MKRILALALLFPLLPVFGAPLSKPLAELVAAERKFSGTCGEKGVRDSFLEFFSDDVVTFTSGVQKGKERLRDLPAPNPDAPRLQWQPVYGDISLAGDLGYTTGPYEVTTKTGQKQYGIFFSIWKRQHGAWKVVLDAGLPTPRPNVAMSREFQAAPPVRKQKLRTDSGAASDLSDVDRRFAEISEKEDLMRAFSMYGGEGLRLHRAGSLPLMGAGQVTLYLEQHPLSYKSEPLGSDVSSSGDLGFVYGSYQSLRNPASRGFYVRVWRRNEYGEWRVALDSMQPARTK